MNAARAQTLAVASYFLLLLVTLAWEGWLAPAPNVPPGLWLTIKALPLLLPFSGLLHGKVYTYKWASLLLMAYLTEGIVLSFTRRGDGLAVHSILTYALLETVLVTLFLVYAVFYVRASHREARQRSAETES